MTTATASLLPLRPYQADAAKPGPGALPRRHHGANREAADRGR
jgi:hypothetical protein